ncbi:MAG: resolvase [Ponticaulis sp.]|nr:resolvase [Ponticaulis sp.]
MTGAASRRVVRCAIYTRKSTEEGLDQEFNSLDAQREACEAYIASQRAEGWKLLATQYDDGGKSGGNLDRPALQRLLEDVRAGEVDLIVVYKIDRLTRSLADFARLVDDFDQSGCSFVSVTQSFNTSTSMGRLTLNVLLSFAQFEREVTAERIRDKLAASKRKGMWMGGLEPFGYRRHPDPKTQSLVIDDNEAVIVRELFSLYLDLGCTTKVERAAFKLGYQSRLREFSSGRVQGGQPFSRGYIHKILTNPIYRGKVRHKDKLYQGQHPAIIDEEIWNQVHARLRKNAVKPRGSSAKTDPSPLAGKLFSACGMRLTPSHTKKGQVRYRYYVTKSKTKDASDRLDWKLPAPNFERFAAHAVKRWISTHLPPPDQNSGLDQIDLLDLIEKLELGQSEAKFSLRLESLQDCFGDFVVDESVPTQFTEPYQLRRRGNEARIVYGGQSTKPDPVLIRAIAKAHHYLDAVKAGERIIDIATREGTDKTNIRRRLELAFLSPNLVEMILKGEQPTELTLDRLMKADIPMDWKEQQAKLLHQV